MLVIATTKIRIIIIRIITISINNNKMMAIIVQ